MNNGLTCATEHKSQVWVALLHLKNNTDRHNYVRLIFGLCLYCSVLSFVKNIAFLLKS